MPNKKSYYEGFDGDDSLFIIIGSPLAAFILSWISARIFYRYVEYEMFYITITTVLTSFLTAVFIYTFIFWEGKFREDFVRREFLSRYPGRKVVLSLMLVCIWVSIVGAFGIRQMLRLYNVSLPSFASLMVLQVLVMFLLLILHFMREKYVAVKDDKIYVVVNNQLHGKFHVQHLEGLDRVNENELVIKYKKRGRDYGNICSLRLTDSEEKIDDIEKMLKKQATLVGI